MSESPSCQQNVTVLLRHAPIRPSNSFKPNFGPKMMLEHKESAMELTKAQFHIQVDLASFKMGKITGLFQLSEMKSTRETSAHQQSSSLEYDDSPELLPIIHTCH